MSNIIPEGQESFQELDSGTEVKILLIKVNELLNWSGSMHIGVKEYNAVSKLFEAGLRDLSRALAEYLKEADNQAE